MNQDSVNLAYFLLRWLVAFAILYFSLSLLAYHFPQWRTRYRMRLFALEYAGLEYSAAYILNNLGPKAVEAGFRYAYLQHNLGDGITYLVLFGNKHSTATGLEFRLVDFAGQYDPSALRYLDIDSASSFKILIGVPC